MRPSLLVGVARRAPRGRSRHARRVLAVLAAALLSPALAGTAPAAGASTRSDAGDHARHTVALVPPLRKALTKPTTTASPETPIPVADSNVPPAGRRLSSEQVLAIAARLPKMRAVRKEYRGSFGDPYLLGAFRWQVSFFNASGKKEIGLVIISDTSGKVLEQWTGFQIAWTMARGYPGAFGRHVNALYIWLPMCLLFIAPFFDFRRPFSLLNLDLLALLSFSVSLAFFNHADIYASVPLTYPPLLYLLGRMLWIALRRRPTGTAAPPRLRLNIPAPWLALGAVFLIGFRIGLNVTDSNVIDVGYAGVIGADRIVDGKPLYGGYPADNEHGDTYGPVNYEAYVPFERIFGWSGTWDDLPAAHAAAIFFDLLAAALLFLIGRRMRGPTLGIVLAYAWVSYPFTLFALESNSNDTLVGALVLAAVLVAGYRAKLAPAARGGIAALAGLTKFSPLAVAPVLATHGMSELSRARRARALALYVLGLVGVGAIVSIPAFSHDSLHTIYERTIAYQADRGSPFSVWGLYGLRTAEHVAEGAAVLLALALALVPRRADLVGLAAACAATIIAVQLGIEHWFYLYIPWFCPVAIVALLGRLSLPGERRQGEASAPARWSRPAAAVSS